MLQSLTARAPAKLIISGEHSVLHGQAAIAMAVDRYTTTTTTWCDDQYINFNFRDLVYNQKYAYKTLENLAKALHQKYVNYLAGKFCIRDVFSQPFNLLQYSVSRLIEQIKLESPIGFEFSVNSTIPLGCGMGSSASAIISALYSLANFFNLDWKVEDFLKFARELENLQHGNSSGLDLHLVTHGGCVRFQNGSAQMRKATSMPLYIVNTGKPDSTTGECVSKTTSLFSDSKQLVQDFGAVTDQVDLALTEGNLNNFREAIRNNHRLLSTIGVVPTKVAKFIAEVEAHAGAAKICGAGAVRGDNAGIVLLSAELNLEHIVLKHGYNMQLIQLDPHGIQII